MTNDEILMKIQSVLNELKGTDLVLTMEDSLTDDLELTSLDAIDLVSVLEHEFSPEVVDALIDSLGELRTVGDLVTNIQAALS